MTTFAVGDVVYLKSGSPPLTVESVRGDDTVVVKWFDSFRFEQASFPPECLKTTQTMTMPNGRTVEVARG